MAMVVLLDMYTPAVTAIKLSFAHACYEQNRLERLTMAGLIGLYLLLRV
jgi:hypothetical protein